MVNESRFKSDVVSSIFQNVGIDKGDIPDLAKVSCSLPSLQYCRITVETASIHLPYLICLTVEIVLKI